MCCVTQLNHPRLKDEGLNNRLTEVNWVLLVPITAVMPDLIRHPDALEQGPLDNAWLHFMSGSLSGMTSRFATT
jgi:hypothetical protein